MRATAVGPDLSRCFARVEKAVPTGAENDTPAAPEFETKDDNPQDVKSADAVEAGMGLPLSA